MVTRLVTNHIIAGEEGEDGGMGSGGHWQERGATQQGMPHGGKVSAGRRPGVCWGRAAVIVSAMWLFGRNQGCRGQGSEVAASAAATGNM